MSLVSMKSKFIFFLFALLMVSCITLTGLSDSAQIIFALIFAGVILYVIKNEKVFWFFIVLIPLLPPFLSFKAGDLPFINGFRILFLILIFDQLVVKKRIPVLIQTIKNDKFSLVLLFYVICVLIPGFARLYSFSDISNLISAFAIVIEKVLFYYLILMNIRLEMDRMGSKQMFIHKFLHTICIVAFVLSVLGVIEFFSLFNVFSLLDVTNFQGLKYTPFIRSGYLRVSSSFAHSLGYSMYLIIMLPLVFYQLKAAKAISKKRHYFYVMLAVLLMLNLFMTLSRSAIISLCVSLLVFFLFAKSKTKIRFLFVAAYLLIPLIAVSLTPLGGQLGLSVIGNNVKALSDSFLGTSYIQDFGNNEEPFSYRSKLISYAFHLGGFEDIFGRGIGFLDKEPLVFYIPELNPFDVTTSRSVDNYYVLVKLEQGWIGLAATMILLSVVILTILKYRKNNFLNFVLLLSFAGYFFELTMVADLDTMKYFWMLLAVFSAYHNVTESENSPAVISGARRYFGQNSA